MNKILLATLFTLVPASTYAQYYPTYQFPCFDWSCSQKQSTPRQRSAPELHHRSRHTERRHTEKPKEHRSERSSPKPVVHTRVVTVTRPAVIRPASTWRSMNQDDARNWIKEQAASFCGRYPTDQACQKKE
jgi:hypothetical protein